MAPKAKAVIAKAAGESEDGHGVIAKAAGEAKAVIAKAAGHAEPVGLAGHAGHHGKRATASKTPGKFPSKGSLKADAAAGAVKGKAKAAAATAAGARPPPKAKGKAKAGAAKATAAKAAAAPPLKRKAPEA